MNLINAALACSVPKLRMSKYLLKLAAWPLQIRQRSRCQANRRTQFTHSRLIWNFVLWNDFSLKFSLKFCALNWFQSEILCFKMISVWHFVLWNEFSLKCCALKWFQSEIQPEILCSEMISVWKFVIWNEVTLNFVLWNEFNLKFRALNIFALNYICIYMYKGKGVHIHNVLAQIYIHTAHTVLFHAIIYYAWN